MTEEIEYDNTNSGALFKNDYKGTNEKAPNLTGTIDIDGKVKNIAAWKRVITKGPQKGNPFLSVKITDKQESSSNAPVPSDEDDDLAFLD